MAISQIRPRPVTTLIADDDLQGDQRGYPGGLGLLSGY